MLNAVNLTCQFHETPLFSGLSFALAAGKCLQVTGDNGSGKTSLLRILSGLHWPDAGQITWRQQPIADIASLYARERLYLGHRAGLKPELTVLENIRLFYALHQQQPVDFKPLLAEIGLLAHQHLPAQRLSVGQQKRLALAQLSTLKAPLWILDEPFAGLDKAGITWLQEKIQYHVQQQGLVILTSHQAINLPATLLELT